MMIFQVVIDELHISSDDKMKINRGEESELSSTLNTLRRCCSKTVIVISSSSLLDQDTSGMNRDQLNKVISEAEYEIVELNKIMRNSQHITNSVSADSFNSYDRGNWISGTIQDGLSSTVTGSKPTMIIYSDRFNYKVMADIVIKQLSSARDKTVILCDLYISLRELKTELIQRNITNLKSYDAGIDQFDGNNVPSYYCDDSDDRELIQWINNNNDILITHAHQFRGCESEQVILVCHAWTSDGYYTTNTNRRSPATRAVNTLTIITRNTVYLNTENVKKYFNVINHKN